MSSCTPGYSTNCSRSWRNCPRCPSTAATCRHPRSGRPGWAKLTPATPPPPLDSDLGQPRWTPEFVHRHLVVRAWGDAAVHAAEWLVAEPGGTRPADHLRAGLEWAASPDGGASDHLAGGCRPWLELRPDSVRVGRQAQAGPSPCQTTSPSPITRRHHSPANCGMTQ